MRRSITVGLKTPKASKRPKERRGRNGSTNGKKKKNRVKKKHPGKAPTRPRGILSHKKKPQKVGVWVELAVLRNWRHAALNICNLKEGREHRNGGKKKKSVRGL